MRGVPGAAKDNNRSPTEPIDVPRSVSSSAVDNTATEDEKNINNINNSNSTNNNKNSNKNDDRQRAASATAGAGAVQSQSTGGSSRRGAARQQFRHQPYHNVSHSLHAQHAHHSHFGQSVHHAHGMQPHGQQMPLSSSPPEMPIDPTLGAWRQPPGGLPSYSAKEEQWRAAGAFLFASGGGANAMGPRALEGSPMRHAAAAAAAAAAATAAAAAGMPPPPHQHHAMALANFYSCGYGPAPAPFPFPPPCGYPNDAAMPCAPGAFAPHDMHGAMPMCFDISAPYGMSRPFHPHFHHYAHYHHHYQHHFHQHHHHHHYQQHYQHHFQQNLQHAAAAGEAAAAAMASAATPPFRPAITTTSPPSPVSSGAAQLSALRGQADDAAEQISITGLQPPLDDHNSASTPLTDPVASHYKDDNKNHNDDDDDKVDGKDTDVKTPSGPCAQPDAGRSHVVHSTPPNSNDPTRIPVSTSNRPSSAPQSQVALKSCCSSSGSGAPAGGAPSENCSSMSPSWSRTSRWSHFPVPFAADLPSYQDSISGSAAGAPSYGYPARSFTPLQGAPRPVHSAVKSTRRVATPTSVGTPVTAVCGGALEDDAASAASNSRSSLSAAANTEDPLPQQPQPCGDCPHRCSGVPTEEAEDEAEERDEGEEEDEEGGHPRSKPQAASRELSVASCGRAGPLADGIAADTPTSFVRGRSLSPHSDKHTQSEGQAHPTMTQSHLPEQEREPQQQQQQQQTWGGVGCVPASPVSACEASEAPAPLGTPIDRRRTFLPAPPALYEHRTAQEEWFEERSSDFRFDANSYGNIVSLINAVSPIVPIAELLEFPLIVDAVPDVREASPDVHIENHSYSATNSLMTCVEPSIALMSIWKALDFPFACTVPLVQPMQIAPMRNSQDSLVYTPLLSGFRLRFHESSPSYSRLKSMRCSAVNATRRATPTTNTTIILTEPISAMNCFPDAASVSSAASPSSTVEKTPLLSGDFDDGLLTWSATERPDQRSMLLEQVQDLAALSEPYAVLLTATTAELDYDSWFAVLWQPVFEQSHMAKNSCGSFIAFYALRPPRHLFHQPGSSNESIAAMNIRWLSPVFRADRDGVQLDVWGHAGAQTLRPTNGAVSFPAPTPVAMPIPVPLPVAESSTTSIASYDAKPGPSSARASCVSSADAARGASASLCLQQQRQQSPPCAGHGHARVPVVGLVPNRCRGDIWFLPPADAAVGAVPRVRYRAPLFLLTAAVQLMARNAEEALRRQDAAQALGLARLSGAQLLVEAAKRNRQYRENVSAEGTVTSGASDAVEGGMGKAGNTVAAVDMRAVVRGLADFYQWAQFDAPLQSYAERYV